MEDLHDALGTRGLSASQANRHLRFFLRDASRAGHLQFEGLPSQDDPSSSNTLTIKLAGHLFTLLMDRQDRSTVLAPLANLASNSRAASARCVRLVADGASCLVSEEGGPGYYVARQQALPAVKGLITARCLVAERRRLFIHGATLVRQDLSLLLLGPPGTGKTTLALYLMQRGLHLAGDDIALLEADGRLTPLAFPPAVKQPGWSLAAPIIKGFAGLPVHERLDGMKVKYVPVAKRAGREKLHPGHAVLLRRTARGAARLTRTGEADLIGAILAEAHGHERRLSHQNLEALTAMAAATRCWTLTYSSAADAAQLLDKRLAAET